MSCCVPQCTNNSYKNPELSFYRFPQIEKFKKKWLIAIRRENWSPSLHSRICSWHFPNGREFGPSRFHWNVDKLFDDIKAPTRKKRKILNAIEEQEVVEVVEKENTYHKNEAIQTDETSDMIDNLKKKISLLERQVDQLSCRSKLSTIFHDDNLMSYYTGLSKAVFNVLVAMLSRFKLKYYYNWTVKALALEDQLLLTLMKLRCNFGIVDLACRFGISNATVTNIFFTLSYALHEILYKAAMHRIPSLSKIQKDMPNCFVNYPNCRQIWDCTDFFIDKPRSNMNIQKCTYSQYRGGNTLKVLVCIAPNGTIVFCSEAYSGNTSDKMIVSKCGIISSLTAGDLILADKGFLLSDIVPCGVCVNIPPFLPPERQFSVSQIKEGESIASVRIHVERAIQRIKGYNILNKIPYQYHPHASMFIQLCSALVNLQNPIIKDK